MSRNVWDGTVRVGTINESNLTTKHRSIPAVMLVLELKNRSSWDTNSKNRRFRPNSYVFQDPRFWVINKDERRRENFLLKNAGNNDLIILIQCRLLLDIEKLTTCKSCCQNDANLPCGAKVVKFIFSGG